MHKSSKNKIVRREIRMTQAGDRALREYSTEQGYKNVTEVMITGLMSLPGFKSKLRQVIKEQNNDAIEISKDRG